MIQYLDFRLLPPPPGLPKQCVVNWVGDSKILYLRIESTKPVLSLVNRVASLVNEPFQKCIPIFQTDNPVPFQLPQLQVSTYSFGLYTAATGECDCVGEVSAFIGKKISLAKEIFKEQDGFVKVVLLCEYKIPSNLFWLRYKSEYFSTRFQLPQMELNQDTFQTSYMLRSDFVNHVEVVFDNRVKEFFNLL